MAQPQPLSFLPTRFFGTQSLPPSSFPFNGVNGWQSFPFHPPLTDPKSPCDLFQYSCRRLIQSTFSTLATSQTDVGQTVKDLSINSSTRLTTITRSPKDILVRLREYTGGGISVTEDMLGRLSAVMGYTVEPGTKLSTFLFSGQHDEDGASQTANNADHRWNLPSAQFQSMTIYGLSGWLQGIVYGPKEVSVASEDAVHDEVHRQLIDGINKLLMARYELRYSEDKDRRSVFPQWSRPVSQAHRTTAKRRGNNRAGIPDFLLYHTINLQNAKLPWEVKTFWSYPSNAVDALWKNDRFETTDYSSWSEPDIAAKVVQQLWGELYFFNSRHGIWTNGEILFLCGKRTNELRLGPRIDWENPDLLETLYGLCCVVIDGGQHSQLADLLWEVIWGL